MRLGAMFLLVLLASSVSACTHFQALTAAPPGRTATLNNTKNEIVLSPGVALAFRCTTAGANPCAAGQATVENPKVAQVYPAHLENLEWYIEGKFTPTSYVVVGLSPGETVLRISGEDPLRVIVQE